jgi:hypothetical protein
VRKMVELFVHACVLHNLILISQTAMDVNVVLPGATEAI